MGYKVDNAIIMAAGTSSRFAPLSYERHKAMVEVKGEVLIERQIKQIKEKGIKEIYIVTGYKAEQFEYLKEKFGVKLVHNPHYLSRNNNASIYVVKDILRNSYICSADNYFTINPFEDEVDDTYYSALYANGPTKEWCMDEGADGYVSHVTVGGENKWYMLGHTFWNETFSQKFVEILEAEYDLPETTDKLWEDIYIEHLDELKMKIRKYSDTDIFEFDSLDELREFDTSYVNDTRSELLKEVAGLLSVEEKYITNIKTVKTEDNAASGFSFDCGGKHYTFTYATHRLMEA